ncbi:MAG TPA: SapC family protein [Pseudomonadaceae bacterium]|nr:SapC family protein [Pseudomonadaceae bacterium]
MTTMLFYEKIVPLNRDQHRKLHLRPSESKARFSADTHYVPVAGTEFYQAARDYPLLFPKDGGNGPIALLGMREGENLFLEEDGAWQEGVYIPAFIRRYPYILARGDESDSRTVCIDEDFPGFGESEGKALFNEEGEPSEYLSGVIDFLNRYATDMQVTGDFLQKLESLDLLIERNLRVTDSKGRNFHLNEFRIINEERLMQLDDATLGELHRKGWLGWIHAHLVSLGNVNQLPVRVVTELPEEAVTKKDVNGKKGRARKGNA